MPAVGHLLGAGLRGAALHPGTEAVGGALVHRAKTHDDFGETGLEGRHGVGEGAHGAAATVSDPGGKGVVLDPVGAHEVDVLVVVEGKCR